ncbi:hypothetical protein [Enterobacter hormaechei]|uniref:hypothetical protein n=1 Tax=Enterobacter hormaechei TaxID=158836 RepID=UPI00079A2CCA|nr:hypothetical protein [Enterobacter hormaechei]ELC7178266.1 hypothetical protein [Enterobacter hormaechei]SAE04557.1 Uncharacterised protein [Enterobacter hormaechei]SAE49233.1 Uncharacterised protein [Enterobacter hormaechei]SAH29709.1 Uncharacterised protein [Enterobacter hormaechei]
MDCRKANIALITIVSALLIISCLVLVKFLFSGSEGFVWGSVSDWVSSLSTLGTLYVAYLAYKNAPNWIKDKKNETGLNHVINLMADYDELLMQIREAITVLTSEYNDSLDLDVYIKSINDLRIQHTKLQSKIDSCRRWKINYPNELQLSMFKLSHANITLFLYIRFQRDNDKEQAQTLKFDLINLNSDLHNDSLFFKKDMEEIFEFP